MIASINHRTKDFSYVSFKGARVNIVAFSDNHGNITNGLTDLLNTFDKNKKEIFPNSIGASVVNILAIVGDWFINPSKKGFITRSELTNGDLQNLALQKTIELIKKSALHNNLKYEELLKKVQEGLVKFNFETIYTMGNHCLDSGTRFMLNVMHNNDMKTLVTNVDLEKSPLIREEMEVNPNVLKSYVYEIPDDKNPELIHKVLFLGVTIPSMDFYNPGLCEGLEFYDNSNQKDTALTEETLQGTINAVKKEVDKFKKDNPKGVVVLLSHMGERLAEIVRKDVPQINHILNGHDHLNTQSNVGKTSINSLGKDNEMIKAINFEFDDNGDLVKVSMTPYFTSTTLSDGIESHPFNKFLNEYLEKDMAPLVSVDELKSEDAISAEKENFPMYVNIVLSELGIYKPELRNSLMQNKDFKNLIYAQAKLKMQETEGVKQGITKLSYAKEIRYQNSYLMNFLTSAVKNTIKEKIDSDIFAVGIQSSIVRGGLADGANNLAVMKVFDGVSEELSGVQIGEISGEELTGMIVENILDNLKDKNRNTIIHWSDIQVDRSKIDAINNGSSNEKYSDAVKVRNSQNGCFEPIDLTKKYKIAIGRKYLMKDSIEWPRKIRSKFEPLHKTYNELFRLYLSDNNYAIHITPNTKENRIL